MTYRIVVGFEGSAHSSAALRWAAEEAATKTGEVCVVFCWQMPFLSFPGAFDRDELESTYKEFLNKSVRDVMPDPGVPLQLVVAEGETTESLLEAAARTEANLLVLGIRGRSQFAGLLLGSVSQGCAAAAPCPVVLVKPTDPV